MVEQGSSTAHQAGRVRDARGRVVTRIDPITMQALHQPELNRSAIETLLNDLEPGLARQLMWRSYVLRVLFGLAVAGAVFVVLWLIGDANFRTALEKVYASEFWSFLPLVICAFVVPLIMARRRHRGHILHVLLKHRLCPHCGYDIRGLPADAEDGATVCPECGCAWQLPREVTEHSA
jgi:hypothetical protein